MRQQLAVCSLCSAPNIVPRSEVVVNDCLCPRICSHLQARRFRMHWLPIRFDGSSSNVPDFIVKVLIKILCEHFRSQGWSSSLSISLALSPVLFMDATVCSMRYPQLSNQLYGFIIPHFSPLLSDKVEYCCVFVSECAFISSSPAKNYLL